MRLISLASFVGLFIVAGSLIMLTSIGHCQGTNCYARATSNNGTGGQAWAGTLPEAKNDALFNCRQYNTPNGEPNTCKVVEAHCTGESNVQQQSPGGWYGFENSNNKDREKELHNKCSKNYKRIVVSSGTTFDALCNSIGRKCKRVCDWEGNAKGCNDSPYSWGDGARIAYCE